MIPCKHRSPHDDGAFGLDQEAHRHEAEAVGLDRLDPLAAGHRAPRGADQVGDRGPVDVGIHQADGRAVGLETVGDGRRQGRLAHAPLARADGDHVLDVGDVALLGDPLAPDLGTHGDLEGPVGAQATGQGGADVALDLGLERAGGGGQVDRQANRVLADLNVPDHAQVHQVAMEVGILHPLQGIDHVLSR